MMTSPVKRGPKGPRGLGTGLFLSAPMLARPKMNRKFPTSRESAWGSCVSAAIFLAFVEEALAMVLLFVVGSCACALAAVCGFWWNRDVGVRRQSFPFRRTSGAPSGMFPRCVPPLVHRICYSGSLTPYVRLCLWSRRCPRGPPSGGPPGDAALRRFL